MKINLNTLKYVVAVDSHRNFVKAAEACGVSQPALSAAIKNMEEELDTVIFDRNSHPARPTPSGEKIISMARATLRSVRPGRARRDWRRSLHRDNPHGRALRAAGAIPGNAGFMA